ncbi:MAG: diguanylate cyclase [Tissierellia bacterium]|nr:diguanylate cyclase [Tissierellia bacterium]
MKIIKNINSLLIKIVFVLIFSIFFLTRLTETPLDPFFDMTEEDLNTSYEDRFVIIDKDRKEIPVTFPMVEKLKKGEKLQLKVTLPYNLESEPILLLSLDSFEDYRVFSNNYVLNEKKTRQEGFFSKNAGPAFIEIKLMQHLEEEDLIIEFTRPDTIDGKIVINGAYLGEPGKVYMDFLYNLRIEILILIILLLVVITLHIMSFILRGTKSFKKIFYFALFASFIGNWFSMQSSMFYYFLSNKMLHLLMEEICLLAGNIAFINFILSYDSIKNDKFIKGSLFISILLSFISLFLWIVGILEFCVISTFVTMISVLAMLKALFILLQNYSFTKDREDIQLFFIVVFVVIITIISILTYIKIGFVSRIAFETFLYVSGLYMSFLAVKEIIYYTKYAEKSELYESLAIRDKLTGLYNKNAFILDTEGNKDINSSYAFIVFDVNNLKSINDNYGHAEGNRIIIRTAELLKSTFSESRKIYRTGGDEFTIVFNPFNRKTIEDLLKEFDKKVKQSSLDLLYDYRVAFGYSRFNGNLEIALDKADRKMYEKKTELKGDNNAKL